VMVINWTASNLVGEMVRIKHNIDECWTLARHVHLLCSVSNCPRRNRSRNSARSETRELRCVSQGQTGQFPYSRTSVLHLATPFSASRCSDAMMQLVSQ
jgi:hypothetical protein